MNTPKELMSVPSLHIPNAQQQNHHNGSATQANSSPRSLSLTPHSQRSTAYPPASPVKGAGYKVSYRNSEEQAVTTSGLTPHNPSSNAVVPYQAPVTPVATAAAATSKSGFNIGDLKGIFDRMGGVEGIVSTMGKVQKVMQSVQQFAPMAKMLVGVFGKSKNKDNEDEEYFYKPTRRRRRRRPANTGRTPRRRRQAPRRTSRTKNRPSRPLRPTR
ncbi:hypothetical protein [Paenibacillus taiwanensis]|uniref:hypothetical protein n=1 Tax=Paenibacillus taiwanensis TaxID=401638 RepID=UPI0003FA411C|nr:hypothetical protein [Paenibacillus taiwanensis]